MSTTLILAGSFVVEVAIIAIGLAVYFYRRLTKLKKNMLASKANNDEQNIYDNLKDIFNEQIKLTQQQVAKYSRGESSSGHRKISRLLSKRIEFLEMEKDISGQEVKDQSYWKKLCDRMAGIIIVDEQEGSEDSTKKKDVPAETSDGAKGEAADESVYRDKILRYQAQIASLHQDFEDYRKSNKRMISLVSNPDEGDDADALLKDLLADIKEHDDRLHTSLSKIQNDNERLQKQLNDSEKSAYKLDYELHRKQSEEKIAVDDISTSAEQEISKLRDIINRQYGSLDELKQVMGNTQNSDEESQMISQKLEAVEKSQVELQTCIEVLEMDNDRLVQALEDARHAATLSANQANAETAESPEAEQKIAELYDLRLKSKEHVDIVDGLTKQLEDKENKISALNAEFASLQDEFMRIYEKQNEA